MTESTNLRYEDRGASADKSEVHAAIKGEDPGLFPGAFCKILPDSLTGSPDHCVLIHADGAGTKAVAAWLWWKETGDASVFRGLAQDSLVMNLDDLLCVGATGPFLLSNTIGRNAKIIPGEIIAEIIAGYRDCAAMLARHGVEIVSGGGETADMGDAVRTLVVDSTLVTRMKRKDVISGEKLRAGLSIVGFASFGKAAYESFENSGMGSNGLTSTRHELLSRHYTDTYPEAFAPQIKDLAYTGPYRLQDKLPGSTMTVGQALLSPTRTYAPILARAFAQSKDSIAAVFHNTGGGQTKCLRFGQNLTYVKDNLFDPPPLFKVLKDKSRLDTRELYRSLNMGHRLEIVCEPSAAAGFIAIGKDLGVDAKVVGRTEAGPAGNKLVLTAEGETLEYKLE
jgi:phosphoribosylformylglycinamidine cyclo-ligase